jgi:hypothetical protein
MPVFGALIGTSLWWILNKAAFKFSRRQVLFTILTPSITITTLMLVAYYWFVQGLGDWIWIATFTSFGLSIGALLVILLRKYDPTFNRRQSLTVIFGWGIAFFLGQITQQNLSPSLAELIKGSGVTTNIVALPIEAGLAGMIGSMFLIGQLKTGLHFRVNWKTVLAATLGFGLGNALSNAIYHSSTDATFGQLFIWGLVAGASLVVPSKDIKRYLLLGALGGIGLFLAYQAFSISGTQLYSVFMGGVFGLFIGIATKNVPRTLIIMSFAITAFTIRGEINPWLLSLDIIKENPIAKIISVALSAGLMGALIGSAWSFINRAESIPPEKPSEK